MSIYTSYQSKPQLLRVGALAVIRESKRETAKLFHQRIRNPQMPIQRINAQIQFFLGNNQRRCNHKVAHPSLLRNPIRHHLRRNLIHNQRLALNLIAHGIERLFCLAILH